MKLKTIMLTYILLFKAALMADEGSSSEPTSQLIELEELAEKLKKSNQRQEVILNDINVTLNKLNENDTIAKLDQIMLTLNKLESIEANRRNVPKMNPLDVFKPIGILTSLNIFK